ncbi:MAG: hypothetical protein KF773_34835 [Deltaproteobacteria bacterium]|nr:hypothetical protein [Deltaproteobacteria bacterium]
MPRRGIAYILTPAWKKAVLGRLAAKGWNKAELARKLECSRTAVTDMLTDGESSTLVPEVEELLGLEISMIFDEIQFVGPTREHVSLADGVPLTPPSETYERSTPVPTPEPVKVPSTPRDVYVQTAEAATHVMRIFSDLNTTNRIRAIERLEALVEEQDYVENLIAERNKTEADRLIEVRLDDKVQIYMDMLPSDLPREFSPEQRAVMREVVNTESNGALLRVASRVQDHFRLGTPLRKTASKIVSLHRDAMGPADLKEKHAIKVGELKREPKK